MKGKIDINVCALNISIRKPEKEDTELIKGSGRCFGWLRTNPHRLHLGHIGLIITKQNGNRATAEDIRNAKQTLDLWTGLLSSSFEADGIHIRTKTCCHPQRDLVSFFIESDSSGMEHLAVSIDLPYGTHLKSAADWDNDAAHYTEAECCNIDAQKDHGSQQHNFRIETGNVQDIILKHTLDESTCYVRLVFSEEARFERTGRNSFIIRPAPGTSRLELSCLFSLNRDENLLPLFEDTFRESEKTWENYWSSGGAIEFKNSTDPRAVELERRVILFPVLMK